MAWVEQQFDLRPSPEWLEYMAAAMITERISKADRAIGAMSAGLKLLVGRADARTPIVMQRLIRDRVYEEEDVAPALAVSKTPEAREIIRELVLETKEAIQRGGRQTRDADERLLQLLSVAVGRG